MYIPYAAPRYVVIQCPIAVDPVNNAVAHLHARVSNVAVELDVAISLVVLVPQRIAHVVDYLHRWRWSKKQKLIINLFFYCKKNEKKKVFQVLKFKIGSF